MDVSGCDDRILAIRYPLFVGAELLCTAAVVRPANAALPHPGTHMYPRHRPIHPVAAAPLHLALGIQLPPRCPTRHRCCCAAPPQRGRPLQHAISVSFRPGRPFAAVALCVAAAFAFTAGSSRHHCCPPGGRPARPRSRLRR